MNIKAKTENEIKFLDEVALIAMKSFDLTKFTVDDASECYSIADKMLEAKRMILKENNNLLTRR